MSKKYGKMPLIPYGFQVNKIYPYAGIERFTLDVYFNSFTTLRGWGIFTTYEQAKEFGVTLIGGIFEGDIKDFSLYNPFVEVDNRCSKE